MDCMQAIKEYINREYTDYAILVDAPWGSGKTYFMRREVIPEISNQGLKAIYVSLNGLKDVHSITRQVIYSRMSGRPRVEPKFLDSILDIVGNLKGFEGVLDTAKGLAENVILEKHDWSKVVLILDDLERISPELKTKDVLGSISTLFLESQNAKVIFVAHEDEIPGRCTDYWKIKEKVIRRTLAFSPSLKKILSSFLKERYGENNAFVEYLEGQLDFIVEIMERGGTPNIRTFGLAMDCFKAVFGVVSRRFFCSKDLDDYLAFTLIISIEYSTGQLIKNAGDIESAYQEYLQWNLFRAKTDKIPYPAVFFERYFLNTTWSYVFSQAILDSVFVGYLDSSKLEQEISDKQATVPQEWTLALSELWKARQLEQDELQSLVEDVLKFATEGRYPLNEYLSIYRILFLIKEQDFISGFPNDYYERLKKGVLVASKKHPISRDTVDSLSTFEHTDDPLFHSLKQDILALIRQNHASDEENDLRELFQVINGQDEDAYYGVYRSLNHASLFSAVVEFDLINSIFHFNNQAIWRMERILDERFLRVSNADQFYSNEKGPLLNIAESIEDFIKDNAELNQMRIARFRNLVNMLRDAANHLESTK